MMRKIFLFLPMLVVLSGCPNDDDIMMPEEESLENVTSEVLLFEFTPDTGNNSSRLHYEIQFNNPNNVPINGFYKVKTKSESLESTLLSTDRSPCYKIEANSSCTFIFDEEDSFDIGRVNSIVLISVEYILEN